MTKAVFEKSGPQHLTVQIVLGLEQIGRSIDNLLWQQATEHELSPLQIRILLFIHLREGHTSVSILAVAFNLSKATISVALKPMEQKKLILKRKSATDKRSTHILLAEWRKQIAHVAGFYLEPLRKVIAPIPAPEKEIMFKNIAGILSRLEAL